MNQLQRDPGRDFPAIYRETSVSQPAMSPPMDPAPMVLSLAQQFEIARMTRTIDATTDTAELQSLCKQLLNAWQNQRAATNWAMRQSLSQPSALARAATRQRLDARKGAPVEAPRCPTSPGASGPA